MHTTWYGGCHVFGAKRDSVRKRAQEDGTISVAYAVYSSPQEVNAYQAPLNKAETLKRRADQLEAPRDTARADMEAKQANLCAARSGSAEQLKKVIQMLGNEDLFKGVPPGGPKAVTNSDGQFSRNYARIESM